MKLVKKNKGLLDETASRDSFSLSVSLDSKGYLLEVEVLDKLLARRYETVEEVVEVLTELKAESDLKEKTETSIKNIKLLGAEVNFTFPYYNIKHVRRRFEEVQS